eukprot:jgi/Mesvir1/29708/Mv00941-RA.1
MGIGQSRDKLKCLRSCMRFSRQDKPSPLAKRLRYPPTRCGTAAPAHWPRADDDHIRTEHNLDTDLELAPEARTASNDVAFLETDSATLSRIAPGQYTRSDTICRCDGAVSYRAGLDATSAVVVPGRRLTHQTAAEGDALEDDAVPQITDLRKPHTWYPMARALKRHIIFHTGPTNSGKTHQALEQLRRAPNGVYLGPLRLLAWEVAERLNDGGTPCDLLTGQEQARVPGSHHVSCTAEMADLSRVWACAVVDEVQLMGCPRRGHAFTRAVLGLAATQLHLCGDPAAEDMLRRLCQETGDELEVRRYERLQPLELSRRAVGKYSNVRPGDCVVAFSRKDIYSIKKELEQLGMRCCLVYGSLPPETRSKQATLFNTPGNGYDVLVASDAVGLGLNLSIRRIILSTVHKFDGTEHRMLLPSEVKQIAGRAGRFGAGCTKGVVSALEEEDHEYIKLAMAQPFQPLQAAGIFPHPEHLVLFSAMRPSLTFVEALEEFCELARLSPLYFLQDSSEMLEIAKLIGHLPLSIDERLKFCMCPVELDDPLCVSALVKFAGTYAASKPTPCPRMFESPAAMRAPKSQRELLALESIHKVLETYIWLSFRFPDLFHERQVARSQKTICEKYVPDDC